MAEITAAARALGHVVDGVDSDVQWTRAVGLLRGMDACGVARVWVRLVSENASLVRFAQCRMVFDQALADCRSVRVGGVVQTDGESTNDNWSEISSHPSPPISLPRRPHTAPMRRSPEGHYLPRRPQSARLPSESVESYNQRLRGDDTPVSDTMSSTINRISPRAPLPPRPSTAPPAARTPIPIDLPIVHALEPAQPTAGTGWNNWRQFFNLWPFTGPPPPTDRHVPDGRAPAEMPPRRRRPHTARPSRQA